MILCIDTQVLKVSSEVSRVANLEDIFLNHTMYCDENEIPSGYKPLDFYTSMRSMFSNLVVEIDKGEEVNYYVSQSNIQQCIHRGYNLIMYLTSLSMMESVNYGDGFDELMFKHTHFSLIGLYYDGVNNPIIYSHIIFSDEGAEELRSYLKKDRKLVHIKDIKSQGNIKALLDTFIEVKEENKNA